ncbi:OLC1v1020302C1 [Oldenlandia corymbosa var. corymbosa]|uniref:OLC1v1020302C1 n=1 Tax=Oldenlandia corymbosa var. corymbosa TaxID=529605 RepID=A0AAV1EG28_OLDCO|nr:OLC1v1020302C1 [Oldenlandia corymbosa var. corymbosa]
MANFSTLVVVVPLIVALWLSSTSEGVLSLSSSSSSDNLPLKPKMHTPTIAASPTVLPDPPLSPVRELSPDIAPLLPHPGSNTIPTIPSSRTPNPDDVSSVGPDPAFAPSGGQGLLQASSSSSGMPFLRQSVVLIKLLCFLVLCLVQAAAF